VEGGLKMILKSGCAFSPHQGIRVLIVSRLTENDGQTPSPNLIKLARENIWIPCLAPRSKTVGAWYRKEIDWEQFQHQYEEYLNSPPGQEAVKYLYRLLKNHGVVKVLCVEETPEHCHRSLLLEYMKKKYPGIEIEMN
jgi:uncharacterized protein YeaO (DUF488 family)